MLASVQKFSSLHQNSYSTHGEAAWTAMMHQDWNGFPEHPESSGWHWLHDGDGLRPMLWRGADWPDAVDRNEWRDGFTVLSPGDLRRAEYLGPVSMSPKVDERFKRELRNASA